MTHWIENWKQNPPPQGELVEVLCDDFLGEYTMFAKRVNYKKGSTKAQLRRGWRWVSEKGEPLTRKEIPSAYRFIKEL